MMRKAGGMAFLVVLSPEYDILISCFLIIDFSYSVCWPIEDDECLGECSHTCGLGCRC